MDEFTQAYLEAALWASVGDDGEPLDNDYTTDDIVLAPYTRQTLREFYENYSPMWQDAGMDDRQAGHDFWLTRNLHGAGFWDRGLGEVGDKLTTAAQNYGTSDAYVGDDGNVYLT